MRQRVALALSVMRDSRLVLIDEPTIGLDREGISQLVAMVHRLRDRGSTIILSSHDLASLQEICDGVTCMRDGRVTYSASVTSAAMDYPADSHILRVGDKGAGLAALRAAGHEAVEVSAGLRVPAKGSLARQIAVVEKATTVMEVLSGESLFARLYEHHGARRAEPESVGRRSK